MFTTINIWRGKKFLLEKEETDLENADN